jgi:small subunit ribosomal protein S2e
MSFTATVTATRRPKRQYPPAPPTPKILHLPRRPRRRAPKSGVIAAVHGKPPTPTSVEDKKGKLEALFDQERVFSKAGFPVVFLESERRRERVGEREEEDGDVEEEKWRFQAEMLRAECNLLRMEKEIAVKKMERIKLKMERTLNSAVRTLVSVSLFFCLIAFDLKFKFQKLLWGDKIAGKGKH